MKVSLFPFLPVLLCMMGAMIMLLVLAAWNVQEQAFLSPDELTTQALTVREVDELRDKIAMLAEEADWHAERFVIARQEAEAELADYQARLALAEKETQKVKDEIIRLEHLARQLDSQSPATPEEAEHFKRLLEEQKRRQAEAERELAELQRSAAGQQKSYAIVPARSADGTFRRPIYIECRNDKIIIQPEGIELLPSDFALLDRPDNPFDTVLRTIRQYYVEKDQVARGSEPYPLMIVRPSGVEMYDNAHTRMLNGNWIRDFGYEIVNEDWNIQYPEPNEELRRRILQQLEVARNRLSGYMMATRRAQPGPVYGGEYGTMPQQFRTDPRGRVVPMGSEVRSAEDLQRYLELRRQESGVRSQESGDATKAGMERSVMTEGAETADGSRQTAGQVPLRRDIEYGKSPTTVSVMEEGRIVPSEGFSYPGEKPGNVEISLPAMMPQRLPQNMSRPQNWALKDATQFTRGISRTVKVRCEPNRLVLSAQAGLAKERSIPITGSVSEAADQLVQAIWEFQESWGSAGENVHWKPILQVRVAPGGEQRLQELRFHLRNSGLVIEE